MSLKAKGLLSMMLSLPDDWNYSVSGLVKLSKDGKDSVMSALAELEEFGYLLRTRTTDSKGRFNGIEYDIYEHPQPPIPVADNPISDNEHEEKQNADKPQQLNTNQLNNLYYKILSESNIKEFGEILDHIQDLELQALFADYINMRESIKHPISKRGLNMLINRCARISNFDREIQKQLLETAIMNHWKNVYVPTDMNEGNRNTAEMRRFFFEED